jgi:gliding motility-associated-like protein
MKNLNWIPLSILSFSSIKAQQLVCPAATANLISASGNQYSWSIGELATLTLGDPSDFKATQGQQQPYIEDAIVLPELPEMIPKVNNGLTINDIGGKNDVFRVANIDSFPENRLTIVNRWGETIYNKDGNYNNDWRGQDVNGTFLEAGTYYYVFQDLRRKRSYRGFLLIIMP